MARLKVIYAIGNPIFFYKEINEIGYSSDNNLSAALNGEKYCFEMDLLLDYLQHTTKTDILLAFEYVFLKLVDNEFFAKHELDSNIIQKYYIDNFTSASINSPKPTYISEYIQIIGQLFLAGYIDFLCDWDDDKNRIDYPTNLSYYKEDKYQAWIYFRDNFFYKERFLRKYDDNYTQIYNVSWDTPQDWSEYNILVARTEKGTKYFNEILAPRIYNKYKDLEVEIDEKGNIIKWIGEINR